MPDRQYFLVAITIITIIIIITTIITIITTPQFFCNLVLTNAQP